MARVLVVGAGVIGLTVAARLLDDGHRVDVVARDLPPETTSAVAAAFWYPYLAAPRDRVTAWASRSFSVLEEIAREHPGSGVRMVPGTELWRQDGGDPWWADALPSLRRVTGVPAPYAVGLAFTAPVAEMPVYLAWLVARVEARGGTITRMALGQLPEPGDGADVVVDASGLGARLLAGDATVTPVRGQVVLLGQVGLDRWWLDSGTASGHSSQPTYVVPRSHDIVVGGTDEPGEWNPRPVASTASAILDRAVRLVPALAGAPVLRSRVGLRPARSVVRLEANDGGRVIHCYGHGGAGVTLSWGCADEVAALVAATGR
ncbi:MAG: FAD-dependent oxidoreductase [Marmoricola sp.]